MNAVYRNRFMKDLERAKYTPLLAEIKRLIALVLENPFQTPPPYEKLKGYVNTYSRRINQQHRLIYKVYTDGITDGVAFLHCWGHYETLR